MLPELRRSVDAQPAGPKCGETLMVKVKHWRYLPSVENSELKSTQLSLLSLGCPLQVSKFQMGVHVGQSMALAAFLFEEGV